MYWAEVGNMKSWQLRFDKDSGLWDEKVHIHHGHAYLQGNNLFQYFNQVMDDDNKALSGKYSVQLIQGCTMTPPSETDIAPFKLYATNSYGVNRSTVGTDRPTCRYDVVEIDQLGGSSFRMIAALVTVQRRSK